ncbi:MAG: helix-turn-helix transcriptional regulator [Gemmatimonadetes bacterium]|nr:helix-turn-helix transcriptional regulator [Gemmatimonadota bacterium]
MTFATRLVLNAASLSQTRARAALRRVSIVTVNGIANNRTTRVDLETLDKLCEVLEVEPGELLERETPKRRRAR